MGQGHRINYFLTPSCSSLLFVLSFPSLCLYFSSSLTHLLNAHRLVSPLLFFLLLLSRLLFLFCSALLCSALLFSSLYFSSTLPTFTSPQAKDSGILRGDVLVNVDGTDTKGLSPEEVAAIIRCIFLHITIHCNVLYRVVT